MQLKIRRSQRTGGILSDTAIFCLDVRADLTDHERRDLTRYLLYNQVIYNSEAARRHIDKWSDATSSGSASGMLRGAVHLALAAMRLNVTIKSLERGHHIECKSMEELLAAEEAFMEACRNLRLFLDVAATFNGSEVVVDFSPGKEPVTIAEAAHPEPILAPQTPLSAPAPPLALPHGDTVDVEPVEDVSPIQGDDTTYLGGHSVSDDGRPLGDMIVGDFARTFLTAEGKPKPLVLAIVVIVLAVLFGRYALG